MRGISRKELMSLPEGVLYMIDFNAPIMIKGETLEHNDWIQAALIDFDVPSSEALLQIQEEITLGKSVTISVDEGGREGWFDDDQIYLLLEESDLDKIQTALTTARYATQLLNTKQEQVNDSKQS